jgi:hypothetical protein
MSRKSLLRLALVVAVPALAIACAESSAPTALEPRSEASLSSGSSDLRVKQVKLLDDCDSVSFNKVLGPGGCVRRGSVTFDEMIAELTAKKTVGAWWFNPRDFNEKPGVALDIVNEGGEAHTFTRVASFAGGVVPILNQLSGLGTVAPECANLDPATIVGAGKHSSHIPQLAAGTYKFQCCFHPWMRTTAVIRY